MRQPTSEAQALAWWRLALADRRTPRTDGEPEAGFYKLRRVKGGPFCAVAIWIDAETDPETGELNAPEAMRAIVNGEPANPAVIWLHCRPITVEEYDRLTGMRDESLAMADTGRRLDMGAMSAVTPGSVRHG